MNAEVVHLSDLDQAEGLCDRAEIDGRRAGDHPGSQRGDRRWPDTRHLCKQRTGRGSRGDLGNPGYLAGDEDSPLPVTASEVRPAGVAALLAAHTYTFRMKTRRAGRAGRDLRGGSDASECRARARRSTEGVAAPAAVVRYCRCACPAA